MLYMKMKTIKKINLKFCNEIKMCLECIEKYEDDGRIIKCLFVIIL